MFLDRGLKTCLRLRAHRASGFTLTELLVALAVAAFVVGTIYVLYVNSFKQQRVQRDAREAQQTVSFLSNYMRDLTLSAAGGLPRDVVGIVPDSSGNRITVFRADKGCMATVIDSLNTDSLDGVLPIGAPEAAKFNKVDFAWVEGGIDSVAEILDVNPGLGTITVDSVFDAAGASRVYPLVICQLFLDGDTVKVSDEWGYASSGSILAMGVSRFVINYDTSIDGNATAFANTFTSPTKPSRVRFEVKAEGSAQVAGAPIARELISTFSIRRGRI